VVELESQGHQVEELKKQLEEARHCQATLEDKQQSSTELIRSLQDVGSTGHGGEGCVVWGGVGLEKSDENKQT